LGLVLAVTGGDGRDPVGEVGVEAERVSQEATA
jgi:hypothetical protein